jgi:hypothetical protein
MLVEGLVSTIIPVHNRAALLREAVTSVLAQTYRPIEIIVVDDGSSDDTGREAEALAQAHPEVRAVHRANGGPGAARETGRGLARGEFIQYLDSDDLLLARKFEVQVLGLKHDQSCGVSYGQTRFYAIGESPPNTPWKRTGERIATMFPSFLQSRWWDTSTPLFRRKVTDLAGPWTNLRNEEDWEYDCRVARQCIRLHYCDMFVSETRMIGTAQASSGGSTDPEKLRSRALAHMLILQHAEKASISSSAPEMQHFARECFLLSRQCGAAGLSSEAAMLFALARDASGPGRSRGIDYRLYGLAARVIGWRALGRLACRLDSLR